MARGEKPYFKHDLAAWRNSKMVALRLNGHADAEPFFWAVLCYVHEERRALDMASVEFVGFCNTMCCSPDAAREQIGHLAEVDLLYIDGDCVSSAAADETIAEWDAKSERRAEAGSKGGSKRKQTEANASKRKQTQANGKQTQANASKRKQTQAELELEQELKQEQEQEQKSVSARARAPRAKHGTYGNVLLSGEELAKLEAEFPDDWQQRVERLDGYIEQSGKSYKSHLAVIRNWARKDAAQGRASPAGGGSKVYAATTDGEGWMPE